MSTHNICFRGEIRKILCGYPLLSVAIRNKMISEFFSKKKICLIWNLYGRRKYAICCTCWKKRPYVNSKGQDECAHPCSPIWTVSVCPHILQYQLIQ